jgi:hypothetical protein
MAGSGTVSLSLARLSPEEIHLSLQWIGAETWMLIVRCSRRSQMALEIHLTGDDLIPVSQRRLGSECDDVE